MGEVTTHQPVNDTAARFEFRARLSLAVIGVFALISVAAIATTASRVDPGLAIFIAGVAFMVAAVQMIIAWGAAGGHAELAHFAARGHQRLHDRLDGIEAVERQTGQAVVVFMDEFSRRRIQRGG